MVFLGLIVLGAIVGPAINIGGGGTSPSTPSSESEEEADFDSFLEYFKKAQPIDEKYIKQREPEGEDEKVDHYEIWKNDDDKRIVGHNLNLDLYTEIDDDLKSEDSYGPKGTKNGELIMADEIEAYEESVLSDIIDAVRETAASKGANLTTYQIYALASLHYDHGGVSAAKSDKHGLIKLSKGYSKSYHGNKDKAASADKEKEFKEKFLELENPDNTEKNDKDYALFHSGYYTDLDRYWTE